MTRVAFTLVLLLSCAPLGAHDFWIEPGTATLRVGENFEGDPVAGKAERIGPALLAYRSPSFSTLTLPREKFERYLQEEGLTQIHPSGEWQRERYARFAKSIVGDGTPAALGWRFELVPLPGSRLQLMYEGQPLAGALVVALNRSKQRFDARTDQNGIVSFPLTSGAWLIKSVHMIPAPAGSGVQWESLWASLTFER